MPRRRRRAACSHSAPTSRSIVAKPRSERPRDATSREVDRVERVDVAAGRRRQAGAIAGVGSGHHVEQQRGVGHGRGEASDHGVLGEMRVAERGDAPVGALQPDEAGEARRGPDRTATVARRAERHHSRRHRGGRATARPARRAAEVPRVARDPEQRARGIGPRPELGRRGLADRDRTGGTQPTDVDRVGRLRRTVREPPRPARRRHAGTIFEVLHAERHAGQGPELVESSVVHGRVDRPRRDQRTLGVDVHERVEVGIVTLDRVEARDHQLLGRQPARTNELRRVSDGGHLHSLSLPHSRTPRRDRERPGPGVIRDTTRRNRARPGSELRGPLAIAGMLGDRRVRS